MIYLPDCGMAFIFPECNRNIFDVTHVVDKQNKAVTCEGIFSVVICRQDSWKYVI